MVHVCNSTLSSFLHVGLPSERSKKKPAKEKTNQPILAKNKKEKKKEGIEQSTDTVLSFQSL